MEGKIHSLSFIKYIPSKHSRFKVKLFSLSEDSGYLRNSLVYLRKNTGYDNENLELKNRIRKMGGILVLLAKDLSGLGYKLYIDNWYTSEVLFNYLYENQTCATGTPTKNRMQFPVVHE